VCVCGGFGHAACSKPGRHPEASGLSQTGVNRHGCETECLEPTWFKAEQLPEANSNGTPYFWNKTVSAELFCSRDGLRVNGKDLG